MYAGQVVEAGEVDQAYVGSLHPYTSGLLQSMPSLARHGERLFSIGGHVPSPDDMPQGCHFEPRCSFAVDRCRQPQPLQSDRAGRLVRCCRYDELELRGVVV